MNVTTAGDIINRAAVEVGLSPVSDPYSSTDPNIVQMRYLLDSLGREIVHTRKWNLLRRERVFTTVAGQAYYPLPEDFHEMLNQTWWNRTNRLPVGGPLSPQEWQYLKARLVGVVFNVLFRPQQGMIELYPDTNTPGGYEIAFEYQSEWWVKNPVGAWAGSTTYLRGTVVSNDGNAYVCQTAGTSASSGGPTGTDIQIADGSCVWDFVSTMDYLIATSDEPTDSDSIIVFDPLLMIRGLKLAFMKAKGFDTTALQQDFNRTLDSVKGHDSPAPTLSASARGIGGLWDPLIGGQSTPITGFGS